MQKNYLNYPVEQVADVFGESPALAGLLGAGKVLIVADMNVVQRTEGLGVKIGRYMKEHGLALAGSPVILSGGERVKMDDMQSMRQVLTAALSAGLGPEDAILALGGGAVLDVAGYAAVQVRGGLGVVRLPTTPAAMIDAAFAESAALDLPTEKDALRLPSVPRAVVIDVTFARTVLDGVWRAGIGEAVRLAVAKDAALLKKIARLTDDYAARKEDALEALVEATLAVRKKKGGSTFGLASAAVLEPKSEWKLPHGYAVPIGVLIDLLAAVKAGEMKEADMKACHDILVRCKALDGLFHSKHILPPELSVFW